METGKSLEILAKMGLSEEPQEMVMFTDEPKIAGYITLPSEAASQRFNCKDAYGQGFHLDKDIARLKSVAEYFERLCISNPHQEVLTGKVCVTDIDMTLFNCYSGSQVENLQDHLKRMQDEKYRLWPAFDYLADREVMLPAQLIFLSDIFDDEYSIRREQITTGAAFGSIDSGQATVNGLLEAAERDACMIAYLTKRKMPQIVKFSDAIQQLLEYLNRYRLETRVYDASTDLGVPTTIAITIDRTGLGPAVNIGSRSDFDYANSALGSILESIQCRRTTRFTVGVKDRFTFPREDEVTSMDNRYFYWYNHERLQDLDLWTNDAPKIEFQEIAQNKSSFQQAVDAIRAKGYHIYTTKITIPELHERGFEVVKVLIPELHPLYLDERAKALYSVHAGSIDDDPLLKPHPFS